MKRRQPVALSPLFNLSPNPVSLWALGSRNCFAGAVFISPDRVHQNEPPTGAPKSCELSGLGMGFDKPDLGFVIHFQRPGSVVAYYQQVGRAGRAVESAYGILLNGREDDEISDYFIRTAFPPAEIMEAILRLLERGAGLTIDELGAELNQPRTNAGRIVRKKKCRAGRCNCAICWAHSKSPVKRSPLALRQPPTAPGRGSTPARFHPARCCCWMTWWIRDGR